MPTRGRRRITEGAGPTVPPGIEPANGRTQILSRTRESGKIHDRALGLRNRGRDRQINGTLASAMKYLAGGKNMFMEIAGQAAKIDPVIQPIVEEWHRCTAGGKKAFDVDQVCELKGVDPFRMLGSVFEAAARSGHHIGALLAAVTHPAIVEKTIQRALTNEGTDEREMLLKHANFLPLPKGSQISVVNQIATKAEVNLEEEPSLPSFSKRMKDVEEATEDV